MSNTMTPYSGARWQRGYGLGSIFRGLFRAAMPAAKSFGKRALKTGLKHGVGLAQDAMAGKNLKRAAKDRMSSAVREQLGGARRLRRPCKRPIKAGGPRRKRARTSRRQQEHDDIFA